MGIGETAACAGRALDGFVPDRFLRASAWLFWVCAARGDGVVRSCAAENEGLRDFRGAVDPVMVKEASAVISSPFAEGPAEVKLFPF